ncbi:MAG: UDP-N-acetylglucosamine 2-epimerase [Bacteroidia bacterium]
MKVGVLTSSRADFGIYLPLLKKMQEDDFFNLEIIAFGTHLSSFYGETVNEIKRNGFEVNHTVESMLLTDSPNAIASAIGLTVLKFADFWKANQSTFDLVFCLGDRYEMFAAVTAGIPFQIAFAHIHGGETTLGAIDNVFRHAITLASTYHFVATDLYANRVAELTSSTDNIYHVGALGLDNIADLTLLTVEEFKGEWSIDLNKKTILTTFHPETVALEKNESYALELVNAIKLLDDYQFLITMPNADTSGNLIRKQLIDNFSQSDRVFLIENLGSKSYFSAMKHCSFLLGNTSSGIIEAASFGKYVINLGDRQKGRAAGENVINCQIKAAPIISLVNTIRHNLVFKGKNIYYKPETADQVLKILKSIFNAK